MILNAIIIGGGIVCAIITLIIIRESLRNIEIDADDEDLQP